MVTIVEQLLGLAVAVSTLTPDDRNARKHGKRNLETIKASLVKYGQRTPIVYQERDGARIVRKGNGTLEAAIELGWKEVAAIGVVEDDKTASGYAIADNRSSELAEWDDAMLAELLDELASETDLTELGFSPDEFSELSELLDGELELDYGEDADDGDLPLPGSAKVRVSHVRMFQLFLSADNIDEFTANVEKLKTRYNADNATDAIFACVDEVCNADNSPKKRTPKRTPKPK